MLSIWLGEFHEAGMSFLICHRRALPTAVEEALLDDLAAAAAGYGDKILSVAGLRAFLRGTHSRSHRKGRAARQSDTLADTAWPFGRALGHSPSLSHLITT